MVLNQEEWEKLQTIKSNNEFLDIMAEHQKQVKEEKITKEIKQEIKQAENQKEEKQEKEINIYPFVYSLPKLSEEEREKREKQIKEIEENRKKAIKQERILNIYKKYPFLEKYTFDNFITSQDFQKTIKNKALEFTQNYKNHWFFIGGQVGAGKTHICFSILNKLLEENQNIIYMDYVHEMRKIKAFSNDIQQVELLDIFRDTNILYIDDMAKFNITNADIKILHDIIEYRYLANKITIISSEKYFSELYQFDQSLFSRILEKCNSYKINIARNENRNFRKVKLDNNLI